METLRVRHFAVIRYRQIQVSERFDLSLKLLEQLKKIEINGGDDKVELDRTVESFVSWRNQSDMIERKVKILATYLSKHLKGNIFEVLDADDVQMLELLDEARLVGINLMISPSCHIESVEEQFKILLKRRDTTILKAGRAYKLDRDEDGNLQLMKGIGGKIQKGCPFAENALPKRDQIKGYSEMRTEMWAVIRNRDNFMLGLCGLANKLLDSVFQHIDLGSDFRNLEAVLRSFPCEVRDVRSGVKYAKYYVKLSKGMEQALANRDQTKKKVVERLKGAIDLDSTYLLILDRADLEIALHLAEQRTVFYTVGTSRIEHFRLIFTACLNHGVKKKTLYAMETKNEGGLKLRKATPEECLQHRFTAE